MQTIATRSPHLLQRDSTPDGASQQQIPDLQHSPQRPHDEHPVAPPLQLHLLLEVWSGSLRCPADPQAAYPSLVTEVGGGLSRCEFDAAAGKMLPNLQTVGRKDSPEGTSTEVFHRYFVTHVGISGVSFRGCEVEECCIKVVI